jgi:hypothetical protein
LRERVLAEAEEHLVKLHKTPEYHRGWERQDQNE